MSISRVGAKKNLQPTILEATLTLTPIFGTAAYGLPVNDLKPL